MPEEEMNIHVPTGLKEKYPTFEFRGKPWKLGGFTWIIGYHKTLQSNFRFCVELGCGVEPSMYEYILKHGRFA